MFTISKKDAEVIAKQATESFEDCLTKYDSLKYPDEPYLEWKKIFVNPQDVTSDHIKSAMEWKYGHWGKASYVPTHKVIIAKVQKYWPEYAAAGNYDIDSTFDFFENKLAGHQNFITISFLFHLVHSNEFEIIDQHNFRSMNFYLSQVSPEWLWRKIPASKEDILIFSSFFKAIQNALKLKDDRKRDLDKFLMMYGKHKVRDANIDKTKIAPSISKVFDWGSFTSNLINVEKIVNRTNADVLMALFIQAIEQEEIDLTLPTTIGDVQKRIPQHKTGIIQTASYNYALIGLLAGQRNRDYLIFQDSELKKFFIEQANNPSRDNSCWKKYLDDQVTINPIYCKKRID